MMSKKYRTHLLGLLLAILFLYILTGCKAGVEQSSAGEEITRVIFEEGESFSGQSVLYAVTNEPIQIEALPGDNKLVFYLSKTCKDCIAEYDSYEFLASLMQGGDIPISFLWQNSLPDGGVPDLPPKQSYRVGDDLRLGDWVPTYFFIGDDGIIRKKTIELSELVSYLAEQISDESRKAMLANYLQRESMVILLNQEEPSDSMLNDMRAKADEASFEKSLVIGSDRESAWADFEDTAQIFRIFSNTDARHVLLYAQDGALVVRDLS